MRAAGALANELAALALDLVDSELDRREVRVAAQLVHELARLLEQVDKRHASCSAGRVVAVHGGRMCKCT